MSRRRFADLPEEARKAVEVQTGPIQAARSARSRDQHAVATALLDTEEGSVFVKGIPSGHPQAVAAMREVTISPYLPLSCPRLLWHTQGGGWLLLGYQAIDGEHADFTDSAELVLVLKALREIQAYRMPSTVLLMPAEGRWRSYVNRETAALFAGDTLLHTDLTPDNVLIGERAYFLNWSSPTRGAAFIDPYCLAVQMIAVGHTASTAVSWVKDMDSWRQAPADALAAFSTAVMRGWRDAATQKPESSNLTMASSAAELRAFLLTTTWGWGRPDEYSN